MGEFCKYCNTLHRAFDNANYCSKEGGEISRVRSNAYYFHSNSLNSGDHISRLSIRTISSGYQTHQINGKEYVLDKSKYLIVPEGSTFESQLMANNPIEGLLVAFSGHDVQAFQHYTDSSDSELLDDPFETKKAGPTLSAFSLPKDKKLTQNILNIKHGIKNRIEQPTFYEEQFSALIESVFQDVKLRKQKIKALHALKTSTKKEIHKRVNLAKEFIDCNLNQNLDLQQLSQVSTMSTFHFLRSFRSIFNLSPHQYIKLRRIQKAKYLLKDSGCTLDEILNQIGLENKSSFIRSFKNTTGYTTSEYKALFQ